MVLIPMLCPCHTDQVMKGGKTQSANLKHDPIDNVCVSAIFSS